VQLVIDQLGLGGNAIEYQAAWDLQRELHQKVVAHQIPDTVLLL